MLSKKSVRRASVQSDDCSVECDVVDVRGEEVRRNHLKVDKVAKVIQSLKSKIDELNAKLKLRKEDMKELAESVGLAEDTGFRVDTGSFRVKYTKTTQARFDPQIALDVCDNLGIPRKKIMEAHVSQDRLKLLYQSGGIPPEELEKCYIEKPFEQLRVDAK